MTNDEILGLIETVLQIEPDTLAPDTELADLVQWDSLSILNLEIELTVRCPGVDFNALRECETVGDILALCGVAD